MAAIVRADLIIASMLEELLHETDDALETVREGVDVVGKIVGLGDVMSGQVRARKSPSDIVLYKSDGTVLQDVVIAEMLLREALATNTYELIPTGIVTIDRGRENR